MPAQIETEKIHFKDEDGNEIPDATFTIRKRLSHEAVQGYTRIVARLPNTGKTLQELSELDPDDPEEAARALAARGDVMGPLLESGVFDEMQDHLIKHGLLRYEGVLDEAGKLIPVERFREADELFVGQVVTTLQAKTRRAPVPNGGGRSVTS